MNFPKDFIWGAATAAYQIEGAAREDGRGESIWDRFSHTPGKIYNGDTGDIACDHYHRYEEDIRLLQSLGVNAYRFSISWPRILPAGRGAVNRKGLDFYRRLAERLQEAGIRPFATLYHWDLPQALEDQGGWAERETAKYFGDYAAVTVSALSDVIKDWITLNEPWCSTYFGYIEGYHAPGRKESPKVASNVIHNLLLAHGYGVQAVRSSARPGCETGIVMNPMPYKPASQKPEDISAAVKAWQMEAGWWFEPLYNAAYPEDTWLGQENAFPDIHDGDMEIISSETDFFGWNYYFGQEVQADPSAPSGYAACSPASAPKTDMNWAITPDYLTEGLRAISSQYPVKKIYITENGASFHDVVSEDGRVHDAARVRFIEAHLDRLEQSARAGIPVKGYFIWSLLDNFEWAEGYRERFGIVYADFKNGNRRIPKDSFYYYKNRISK